MADALIERLLSARGGTTALAVEADRALAIAEGLRYEADLLDDIEVRLILGRSCTTAAKAIDHVAAALQVPYGATRGWSDFVEGLEYRPPQLVAVVMDASFLLRHEEVDLWRELVGELSREPGCLRATWSTLVLVDDPFMWQNSRFGSAEVAQGWASQT